MTMSKKKNAETAARVVVSQTYQIFESASKSASKKLAGYDKAVEILKKKRENEEQQTAAL